MSLHIVWGKGKAAGFDIGRRLCCVQRGHHSAASRKERMGGASAPISWLFNLLRAKLIAASLARVRLTMSVRCPRTKRALYMPSQVPSGSSAASSRPVQSRNRRPSHLISCDQKCVSRSFRIFDTPIFWSPIFACAVEIEGGQANGTGLQDFHGPHPASISY